MTKILRLIAVGIAFAALFGNGPHAQATAAAGGWQYPCFPQDRPDYAFGQYISGGWGYHTGADICHDAGVPVYAAAQGRVMYSARTPDSYRWGNLILIEHDDPYVGKVVSLYGHLGDNRAVAAGQVVSKGQLLGYTGPDFSAQNGNWGAHTHFSVHAGPYGAGVGSYAGWVHGYDPSGVNGWYDPIAFVTPRLPAYDSGPVAADGNGPMYNSEAKTIKFYTWNTGSATWKAGGDTPIRLGTIGPNDRSSIFYQAGADGWSGATRLTLDADTPPAGLATFTATFTSNHVVGNYVECFNLLQEGVAWLPANPMCVGINILPPMYRSAYIKQLVTPTSNPLTTSGSLNTNYLVPGQKVNVKVILKNIGELTWDNAGANPVRLGTEIPQSRDSAFATMGDSAIPTSENWLAGSRASAIDGKYDANSNTITAASVIAPGETGVFSFTMTVPAQAGTYNEYFRPVADGAYWMEFQGIYQPMRVLAPGYHYEYVGQSPAVAAGSTTASSPAYIQLRNTGQTAWPVGGNVRLATDNPPDNSSAFQTSGGSDPWLNAARPSNVDKNITSPGKSTIDPGEVGEFDFTLTIPSTLPKGEYRTYVRPVVDGVQWFPEAYGIYLPVTVTASQYDYAYVKQIVSRSSVDMNTPAQVSVALTNTGRTAWQTTGPNAVKLAPYKPADRNSQFATLTGTDPWPTTNRASLIDGKVTNMTTLASTTASVINPGETAVFRFTMTPAANLPAGDYKEYFNVVVEGLQWLTDIGIYIPLTVTTAQGATVQSSAAQSQPAAPVATPMPTASLKPSATPTP